MIVYSTKAAKALGFLKKFYNDIEIYVEDTAAHNALLFFFRKILGPGVRLSSVNQLGGRGRVIDACKLDQINDGRKKLYIIDADLDLIRGRSKPRLRHLHRLQGYCFENMLLSDSAVLQVALESDPDMLPADADRKMQFLSWLQQNANLLAPLFMAFAIVQEVSPSTMTIKRGVFRLCLMGATGLELSKLKIFSQMRAVLKEAADNSDLTSVRKATVEIRNRKRPRLSADRFISAKDYLFPLLYSRLHTLFGYRGRIDQLKTKLASEYEAKTDPRLARRIREIAAQ